MAVGLLPSTSAALTGQDPGIGTSLTGLKQPKPVPVVPVRAGGNKRPDIGRVKAATRAAWPAPGTRTVDVTTQKTPGRTAAGEPLPVSVSAVPETASKAASASRAGGAGRTPALTRAQISVKSRAAAEKAGVDGPLFTVGRADAATTASQARVSLDYAAFKDTYGGDWAARLRLVQLPACALTTPEKAACRTAKPLKTVNDTKSRTLTAVAPVPAGTPAASPAAAGMTVLAATADAGGSSGSFTATSLEPSGAWSAGSSTGGFSWSYPVGVPAVPGGLKPGVTLGYSSQAVDGRTSASNNQAGWIGDGWGYEPGYIERRYKSCEDDKSGATNTTKVGDQCWFTDNAVLSLGGKTTELVFDAAKGWRPTSDGGEKIEKLSGADNGDAGTGTVAGAGEYWKVTTLDGTQYFFGRHKLPGWATGNPVTNSTLTVPVFGNHTNEPCATSSFATSWCQQAWRWNLDYVVDPRGNAMAYFWKKETNNYGRNVNATTGASTKTPYNRGGYLERIEYGLRDTTPYAAKAMGKVTFTSKERCDTNCTFDTANALNWPDTPVDLYCKDTATECKGQYSPSFWSSVRLTDISTQVLTAGAYATVDSWHLTQTFPPSGDGISTPMWLQGIKRTATDGAATADVPMITFTPVQKPNRVDKLGDGLAPFIRMRMSQITTESGGTIGVDYYDPDCTATSLPPVDDTNSTRCYTVKTVIDGPDPEHDWFNTYPVQRVTEGDNVAGTPDVVTEYAYVGGAEWAKSEDEFSKAENRTYSLPRGYHLVQTRTGSGFDKKTLSESRYFRGMDGASVKNSAGVGVTDREQFAGMLREKATYDGDGGPLVSASSYVPWRSAVTATRARTGLPALEAYMTGTQTEETRVKITGGERTTRTVKGFDSYGLVTTVSELGDVAKSGDEKCTTTTYARTGTSTILDKVSRSETVAVACGETASRPADVIDDVRTYYDGLALHAAPTKGLVTKSEQINGAGTGYEVTSSTPSTCGTGGTQLCYDVYGRQLAEADAYGKVSRSAFTPATGEVPTSSVVTNPLGHTITTVLSARRGLPTKVTDTNGKITTNVYDPLGRVTKAWLPGRAQATYPTAPNFQFEYLLRNNGPAVVTTKALTHDNQYRTSYSFQDGLLRALQTQEESPDRAGRLVTEVFYNTRGEAVTNSGTYFATGAPEPVLVTGQQTMYPSSTQTEFDGLGRPTAVIAKRYTDETKRTTTTYTGDTSTVVPPAGGIATTTVVDALNRTVELKQYTDAARTTSQSTRYAYDNKGRLAKVTDPTGAEWTYQYDIRGRETVSVDPDKGKVVTAYDKGDRTTDVTDARQVTLHSDYDDLGRRTALKKGAKLLASWSYDPTGAKGQPWKSTRYDDAGNAWVTEAGDYDDSYQPQLTKVTVPASETGLAGTYEWHTSYNANTGQVQDVEHPQLADLPYELVSNGYTAVTGLLDTVGTMTETSSAALVSDMTYDHYGRAIRAEYGEFGRHVWTTSQYDDHTGQVTNTFTDRDTAPQRVEDTSYTYDPAGNITAVATGYDQGAARTTDTQCFALDALRRITEAWTNTGTTCAAAPSAGVVGGPDAYWTSYTYDAVGNRNTEVQHQTPSGPAADTTRTYTAPAAGTHKLPGVTQTGANPRTETYTYDATGNTETRKIGNADLETLFWDDEGHLKSTTKVTDTTSYLYDTAGQRLVRRDSTGTTLYLPGGNELHKNKAGKVTGTRYYGGVAMYKAGKLTFLLADHHGTGSTQITNDAAQTVTRRKTTIFGAPRGIQPANWIGDKGFVGGTRDADTSLTHLGAREYDPAIGRFISVDPILDLNDPQQSQGYSYGNNNPVSFSDPSGLRPDGPVGGADYNDKRDTRGEYREDTAGSGWFLDRQGGWSYRYREIIGGPFGGITLSQTIWSDRATSSGYAKMKPLKVVKNPPPPVNFYGRNIGPVVGGIFLPDAEAWTDCFGDGPLVQCAWAATDIPIAKPLKGLKALKGLKGGKAAEKAEDAADAVGTVCGTGKKHSFLPGTKVLLADGSTKKIEDIRIGDIVLATDPDTGETRAEKVLNVIVTEDDKDFTELTVKTKTGQAKIVATDTHPFWSVDLKKWIDAGKITRGIDLRTPKNGNAEVLSVRHFTEQQQTYDLTVDRIHTYYVLAGKTPVLVHNAGGLYVRGPKDPLNFGSNYTGRVDRFDIGGTTDFEVHVYHKGKEVGIFGSDGWFSKHGKSADVDVPRDVYNNLKGLAVGELRRDGRIGEKGTENVKGDNWKRPRITGGGC
ncbi:RHS repeat-associated core domain-containing protein [Streptomyces sp. NPDC093071]|uniref:RHS repeat-associated core domain-containing protein n=1 Tax=Streptomyces sp. NPDC093071 TaxID=3366022 RepID=UPI003803812E